MFITLERVGRVYLSKTLKYKIIDDDFEEIVEAFDALEAVIKVYKSKNLNVAKNIVRFIQEGKDIYNYINTVYNDTNAMIDWINNYAPECVNDIKKYLILA